MGEKLVVGPFNRGLRNDKTAFAIDNDSFPVMINAYQWRGRVKRKRGTSFLTRLQRFFNSASVSYNPAATVFTLNGSGVGNFFDAYGLPRGTIIPGSVTITSNATAVVYTDPAMNGTLSPSGSINYGTGTITIAAEANNSVRVVLRYYPLLPVMGLEDLTLSINDFPGTLGFDTKYSYNILTVFPYTAYDVSFYKNPPASASLPGYVQKTNVTPTSWNGQDYQQFWTVNYQGALWATNGVTTPFSIANIGMQYKPIVTVTVTVGGPPAIADLNIVAHGLVVGDFVFINEVVGTTGINFQTGYVTAVPDANTVTVEFPSATIATNGTGGIAQYLTNRSDATKDCIRWYDGDPTNGSATAPVLNGNEGWVNFCPPLNILTLFPNFSIADLPPAQYYLVGARMIVTYKDRLLFLGPVIQTSAAGSQVYLQNTIIYSQNGTPYYTASFTGDPTLADTVFQPMLVPINQTASAAAYFEDVIGFGGFTTAGIDETIIDCSSNEDVLLIGFTGTQTRLIYSGNDLDPFNFFLINSELGSGSTFSVINMDRGKMDRGDHGFIITGQTEAQRIDLDIPDEVFQIKLTENGPERVCAERDYINEWIYFTYPSNIFNNKFSTQTLQYNYRDNSWAVFRETYTTYGTFRKRTGRTWATIGLDFPTWKSWNEPWNAGSTTLLQPSVIGGNQQGFVILRDEGTNESNSLVIQNIAAGVVTSANHSLNTGDYIIISDALGTIGTQVNDKIFSILRLTADTFSLNPPIGPGTYLGEGLIKRMYVPFVQTKQFPVSWGMGRKTRIGFQQYLLSTTALGQITLLIYLSQNANDPYNNGFIVPDPNTDNGSLIYSTILYTCPESTNLGLTPANVNLQMPTAFQQQQIWHRVNTSLIGDTIQLGFTLSDIQMRDVDFKSQFAEIELHGFNMDLSPSMWLS